MNHPIIQNRLRLFWDAGMCARSRWDLPEWRRHLLSVVNAAQRHPD